MQCLARQGRQASPAYVIIEQFSLGSPTYRFCKIVQRIKMDPNIKLPMADMSAAAPFQKMLASIKVFRPLRNAHHFYLCVWVGLFCVWFVYFILVSLVKGINSSILVHTWAREKMTANVLIQLMALGSVAASSVGQWLFWDVGDHPPEGVCSCLSGQE